MSKSQSLFISDEQIRLGPSCVTLTLVWSVNQDSFWKKKKVSMWKYSCKYQDLYEKFITFFNSVLFT